MHRAMIVFICAAAVMLGAFRYAGWYADNSAMPRYCANPLKNIKIVRKILTEEDPVGDDAKRAYVVAAKLVFLVPQTDGEDVDTYILRLQNEISQRCGQRL